MVCGQSDITVHQCLILLEKWNGLIVGPKQIILGLIVDTNKMTAGITDEYIQKIRDLLNLWDPDRRLFKVNNMKKLIGKLAQLGEGAPWVFNVLPVHFSCLRFEE
jgi:hypothetical protein